ncbi:hypothetical protein BASA62_001086 [Batrachochytrium salamandrivorans]|nr:hypothetical protein BASA62_001086 [Batrachochytrium salamandrivorans]
MEECDDEVRISNNITEGLSNPTEIEFSNTLQLTTETKGTMKTAIVGMPNELILAEMTPEQQYRAIAGPWKVSVSTVGHEGTPQARRESKCDGIASIPIRVADTSSAARSNKLRNTAPDSDTQRSDIANTSVGAVSSEASRAIDASGVTGTAARETAISGIRSTSISNAMCSDVPHRRPATVRFRAYHAGDGADIAGKAGRWDSSPMKRKSMDVLTSNTEATSPLNTAPTTYLSSSPAMAPTGNSSVSAHLPLSLCISINASPSTNAYYALGDMTLPFSANTNTSPMLHSSPILAMQHLIGHTTGILRPLHIHQNSSNTGNTGSTTGFGENHQQICSLATAEPSEMGAGYTGGVLPLLMGVLPRKNMAHRRHLKSSALHSEGNLSIDTSHLRSHQSQTQLESQLQSQQQLQQLVQLQQSQTHIAPHISTFHTRAQRGDGLEPMPMRLMNAVPQSDMDENIDYFARIRSHNSLLLQTNNIQISARSSTHSILGIPAERSSVCKSFISPSIAPKGSENHMDTRMVDSLRRLNQYSHTAGLEDMNTQDSNVLDTYMTRQPSLHRSKPSRSYSTIQPRSDRVHSAFINPRPVSLIPLHNKNPPKSDMRSILNAGSDLYFSTPAITDSAILSPIKTKEADIDTPASGIIDMHDMAENPGVSVSKKKQRTTVRKATFLDPFFQPFDESPTTGWTLEFPPSIEAIVPNYLRLIGNIVPLAVSLGNILMSFRKDWETRCYQAQLAYMIVSYIQNLNISYHIGYKNALELKAFHGMILLNTLCTVTISYTVLALPYVHITIASLVFCLIEFLMEVLFGYYATTNAYISSGMLFIAINITGLFFKYSYELHLRKAFVRYRLLYHNQEELSEARARSDALLGMVLPTKIVASLRMLDDSDASKLKESINSLFAELHGVTILFADIAGFTEFSGTVTASALVGVLSELFSIFDAIASDLQLEKIKTIGDSFHVAGGVPEQLKTREEIALFAKRVCTMGVEMMRDFNHVCAEKGMTLRLRVGIHTGSVVGGVMGLWKFKYDIWSQDVDIASILEQTGTPGLPHISQTTYSLLENDPDFVFDPAENITAFGRDIKTYHITSMQDVPSPIPQPPSSGGISQSNSHMGPFPQLSATMVKPIPQPAPKKSDAMARFNTELNRYVCLFNNPDKENEYRMRFMDTSSTSFCTAATVVVCVQAILVGVRQTVDSSGLLLVLDLSVMTVLITIVVILYIAHIQHNWRLKETNARRMKLSTSNFVNMSVIMLEGLADAVEPTWPWWLPNVFAVAMFGIMSISAWAHLPDMNSMTRHIFNGCEIVLFILHLSFFGIKSIYVRLWLAISTSLYIIIFVIMSRDQVTDQSSFFALGMESISLVSLGVIAFAMSWYTDLIARINFFMERENEIGCREMEVTQQAAERLIMNILPLTVVQRLADANQTQIADDREDTAIIFISISNFKSNTSEKDWLWILNDIICEFDMLAMQYGIEKIKTIGTKYMAMGESTDGNRDDTLFRTCKFGLALLSLMQDINGRLDQDFKLKIGVNVGPAVTGLIGIKTFAFDVWGDTVNVSSRMESTGTENQIQVTQAVVDRCADVFEFEKRGEVYVKGKGNMTTYWLVDCISEERQKNNIE